MSSEEMAVLDEELKCAQDGLKEGREELKEFEKGKLGSGYLGRIYSLFTNTDLSQVDALPKTQDLPLETKRIEADVSSKAPLLGRDDCVGAAR